METFSAELAICAGNSPVPGEFPAQRPVTRSFDVFFDLRSNKQLSKKSWGWWFEMLSHPLWRHCNAFWCRNQNIPGWQGQYHECWCHGSLRHQATKRHGIYYTGEINTCNFKYIFCGQMTLFKTAVSLTRVRSRYNYDWYLAHQSKTLLVILNYVIVAFQVQSSAVIARSNITWFCIWYDNDWGKICIWGYVHKRHPISRPFGRAMGCHL